MIAHDDRILHWALQKLLRREEREDLAPGVLEAWERGERGSWTPGRDELPEPARTPLRRPWPRLAAAAAVLLTGGVAFFALRGPAPSAPSAGALPPTSLPTSPAAFAQASRPLESLAPGAAGPATTLASGERVLVPEDEPAPVEIRLAGGGRLLASPGSVLSVEEVRGQLTVGLELGALRVRRGSGPALAVDAGFARLDPDPWAAFRVSVEPDDAAWMGAGAPSAARAVAAGRDLVRVLLVEMETGAAELSADGEAPWTLRENDAVHVLSAPEGAASVARADIEWMVGLCRRAAPMADEKPPPTAGGTDLAADDAQAAETELRAFLDERPERWALLQPVLLDLLREERPESYRRSVLDVITADPSPGALRAARALWRESPVSFEEDHVVALAARGAFEFQREARARVDGWHFGGEPVPVRSAAWLASIGDERGLALLEDAAAVAITDEASMLDVFVAALALDALGRPEAWTEARSATAAAALGDLERGEEDAARAMAASLDYVESLRSAGRPVPVAFLGRRMELHRLERADDLATVEALRAALEGFGG